MANAAEMTCGELPPPVRGLHALPPPVADPCDEALLRECLRIGLAAIRSRYPRFPSADAEDIVQELAVVYLGCPDRVKAPEAWFFACAAKRAQRFLLSRRMTEQIPAGLRARETNWEAQFISRQLLLTLRSDSRVLLGRLFIAGFSVREIAAAEGCTPQAVYSRAAKDLKRLRARNRIVPRLPRRCSH